MKEALCGLDELLIKTLSTERPMIKVKTEPGQVCPFFRWLVVNDFQILKDKMMYQIDGEGFPRHKNPFDKGNLIIQFSIAETSSANYVKYLANSENLSKIEKLLGERDDEIEHQDCEEVLVEDFDPEKDDPHGNDLVSVYSSTLSHFSFLGRPLGRGWWWPSRRSQLSYDVIEKVNLLYTALITVMTCSANKFNCKLMSDWCVLKRKDISGNKNGKSGVCCVCVLTG